MQDKKIVAPGVCLYSAVYKESPFIRKLGKIKRIVK